MIYSFVCTHLIISLHSNLFVCPPPVPSLTANMEPVAELKPNEVTDSKILTSHNYMLLQLLLKYTEICQYVRTFLVSLVLLKQFA